MKHAILLSIFSFFSLQLFAQSDKNCIGCGNSYNTESALSVSKSAISIFPNPTTDYVAVNDDSDRVNKLEFYNLTGRQMKAFAVTRGEKYSISELPDGVYFVRLIDKNNRIVITQRVNKR
jgi:Secretion system C-terminal sorting domain